MLEMLAGAALRSVLLAAVVGTGLRLRRRYNPHVSLMAWTLVLAASLLMPVATRLGSTVMPQGLAILPALVIAANAPPPLAHADSMSDGARSVPAVSNAPIAPSPSPAGALHWRDIASLVYLAVFAALLLRLLAGFVLSWRIVRTATPLCEDWAGGFDVRASARIAAPATFGSVILLPVNHAAWTTAKRSAVLAHEGAHVARHDFAIQFAACVNRAVFWFNPLSWWLQRHLSDLAEAASDDAAIAGLDDRLGYAEILLEVSGRVQALPHAVAMARRATVASRIERILSETAVPAGISRRGRMLLVAGITLLLLAVAGPLAATTAVGLDDDAAAVVDRSAPHQRIAIDPALLDADVGFYEDMASGSMMTVTRDGDHLLTGRMGAPPVAEYPYAAHGFFLTVSAEQNTFVTDASGKVGRVIHYKNGLATTLERISPEQAHQLQAEYDRNVAEELKPNPQVAIDPKSLDDDVGYYALTPTFIFTVTRDGDQLFVQGTDRKKFPVFPYSDRDFFYTSAAAQLTFVTDGDGPATALILHQDGKDRTAQRVGAGMVQQLQQRLDDERKPRAPIAVAGVLLDSYAGRYANAAITMTIHRDHDHLSAQVMGYNEYCVYPYTDRDFFAIIMPAQISFERDSSGDIVRLVRHEHGEDVVLDRVD